VSNDFDISPIERVSSQMHMMDPCKHKSWTSDFPLQLDLYSLYIVSALLRDEVTQAFCLTMIQSLTLAY